MSKDVECPYCGEWQEICHDDGFGYEEDEPHEMECGDCEKNFVFYTSISYDYEPRKADCLNGGPHQFTDWKFLCRVTQQKVRERRRCHDCGKEECRNIEVMEETP